MITLTYLWQQPSDFDKNTILLRSLKSDQSLFYSLTYRSISVLFEILVTLGQTDLESHRDKSKNPLVAEKESELANAKREIKELKKENQMNQDLVLQKNKLKKKLEECETYAKDLKTKNENLKSEIQIMKNMKEKRFVTNLSRWSRKVLDILIVCGKKTINIISIFSEKLKALISKDPTEGKKDRENVQERQEKDRGWATNRGQGKDRGRGKHRGRGHCHRNPHNTI